MGKGYSRNRPMLNSSKSERAGAPYTYTGASTHTCACTHMRTHTHTLMHIYKYMTILNSGPTGLKNYFRVSLKNT